MYVTRPLSLYKRSPEAAFDPPPEGPHSGCLVIADEEWEDAATKTCCWGQWKVIEEIKDLPFPQNKILTVRFKERLGENQMRQYWDSVLFIPVAGQPLSSNRYYAIQAEGKHIGQACTCSREDDMKTFCFCNFVQEFNPSPLDHTNIYQQMEIRSQDRGHFTAKSLSPDGFPPSFLRREGWWINASSLQNCQLEEAHGIDVFLRFRRPKFDFSISSKQSSLATVVGKWYCPFMFISEEGTSLKDQMKRFTFYEMTLELLWEEIHSVENSNSTSEGNVVVIDRRLRREAVRLANEEREADDTGVDKGFKWFRSHRNGGEKGVGLSMAVVERMKWEAARGGWEGGSERDVKVERVEEFKGVGGWSKYGCYMLVERFVLKRMDKSMVLTYDFRHTHLLQSKWE